MSQVPRYFWTVAFMAVFHGLVAVGMAAATMIGLRNGASPALVLPGGLVAVAALTACLWSLRAARRVLQDAETRSRAAPPGGTRRCPNPSPPARRPD